MSETASQELQPAIAPAFAAIYREHYAFVWKSVRRLGIPDAEVDDVVQDVFVVVHRRLGDFEARSSMRTWLFGIAYRVVRDKRRSFAARIRREGEVEPARPPTAPDQRIARHQAVGALDDLLARLDEDQRSTFVMAEMLHMSAPEIATLTEVKLNTVYSRLRRAREVFEAALQDYLARNGGELPWLN
ncbi:MAG TPA: sigma-70 family RNA polymerase sigma factor [Nannocystaceae bacterium]|nr:sigma-70 family RNA polymerase sigma factor [Nannocystaceae bacterium]